MFLIAEYYDQNLMGGWQLFVRDQTRKNRRNADGGWGWLHRESWRGAEAARPVFEALGIAVNGELRLGQSHGGAIHAFAKAHALPRSTFDGHPRGCVEVEWVGGDRLLRLTKGPTPC